MKSFKDDSGRQWSLGLNLGSAMAVKNKLGVDLLQPEVGDPPLITRLGTDELLLAEVICCLIEEQFSAQQVTVEEVYRAFDGQTLLAAQKAFYEELSDFFRSRGRTDRAQAVSAQARMIEAAIKKAEIRISGLDVEKVVAQQMSEPTPGETSGSSPAASGSTPDR